MLGLETVILIGALAAGSQLSRPTRDVYDFRQANIDHSAPLLPTQVAWADRSNVTTFEIDSSDSERELLAAFSAAGISQKDGLRYLTKAKALLASMSCRVAGVDHRIAYDDADESVCLSVRLLIDADLETAMDFDFRLSREMVRSFDLLPVNVTFEVHERGVFTA